MERKHNGPVDCHVSAKGFHFPKFHKNQPSSLSRLTSNLARKVYKNCHPDNRERIWCPIKFPDPDRYPEHRSAWKLVWCLVRLKGIETIITSWHQLCNQQILKCFPSIDFLWGEYHVTSQFLRPSLPVVFSCSYFISEVSRFSLHHPYLWETLEVIPLDQNIATKLQEKPETKQTISLF